MNTSNTSKHTPGPWSVRNKTSVESRGIQIANCGFIMGDWPEFAFEEERKNAQLIAAAPDLLEALESLLNRAQKELDQSATHDGMTNCQAIATARQAIAKALGQ